MIKKYSFSFLIILAFTIRLVLMPISAHSDFYVINMFPSLFWRENVIDILSYSRQEVNRPGFSYYPPLTYFTFSVFQFLYQPFSDTFIPWVDQLRNLYVGGFRGTEADYIKFAPNQNLFKDIFIAKIPYLTFEVGCLLILIYFAKKRKINRKVIFLWLFNPLLIYDAYVFGQFDIIPAFFVLLAFLLLNKNPSLAMLLIGVAGAFKNYSYIFIFPVATIYGKSLLEKIKLALIGFIPTTVFTVPTFLTSPQDSVFAFFNGILLHSKRPLEGWPLYSQIIRYSTLAMLYGSIIILSSVVRIKDKWRLSVGICYIVVLLVLTLVPRTSFHYLMWSIPLALLWFKDWKILAKVVLLQTITFASYKILAPQLQAGLFAPLNPDYFYNLPTFNEIFDRIIPYQIISAAGFFAFFFLNIYIVLRIISEFIFSASVEGRRL